MFMPGVWFLWFKKKKKSIFQKENGNTLTLLIIILVKSIQKEQIAQITQYDPWSTGINLRSTQSDLTPQILTLPKGQTEGTQRVLLYKPINGTTQKMTKILKMKVQTLKIMIPCWKSYLEIQELLMTLAPINLVTPQTINLMKAALKDLNTSKPKAKTICK